MNRTILKIGGSLLLQPNWPQRLKEWLAIQPPGDYLTIVGGGAIIDAMRQLDTVHLLDQTAMHWRCIRLLDATFEIARERLPEANAIRNAKEFATYLETRQYPSSPKVTSLVIVCISSYYDYAIPIDRSQCIEPLIGWETTSDTLAMHLAEKAGSQRCVLFKSCPIEHFKSLDEAIEAGVVDAQVQRFVSKQINCQLVQL